MPPFVFKRFSVNHDRSSMKVGTDGVLLGAWVSLVDEVDFPVEKTVALSGEREVVSGRVLEIGCGCGVVSLMLAQRLQEAGFRKGSWHIDAIDIHGSSCEEACGNVAASPWPGFVSVHRADFLALPETLEREGRYFRIVSNPPFFSESLKCPDPVRRKARHNDTLPFGPMLAVAEKCLADTGRFALIVPPASYEEITGLLSVHAASLHLCRLTRVYSKPDKPCERILAEWEKSGASSKSGISSIEESDLLIYDKKGVYHPDYVALVKSFYLWG